MTEQIEVYLEDDGLLYNDMNDGYNVPILQQSFKSVEDAMIWVLKYTDYAFLHPRLGRLPR